jgi:hypothetical protein
MPRALQSIFSKLRLRSDRTHKVKMSCFQLYREQAFDLLHSAQAKVPASLSGSSMHHRSLGGLASLRMRWSKLVRIVTHKQCS